jgi:hypothetical protein
VEAAVAMSDWSPEHIPDGAWTGQYICVTCGAEVVVCSELEEKYA